MTDTVPAGRVETTRHLKALALYAVAVHRQIRLRHGLRQLSFTLEVEMPTPVDEIGRVPAVDLGMAPRAAERRLAAAGWRFVAVPVARPSEGRQLWEKLKPTLDWFHRTWLVIPPDALDVPARHFKQKGQGLGWALALEERRSGEGDGEAAGLDHE